MKRHWTGSSISRLVSKRWKVTVGVGYKPAVNSWKPATDLRGSECNYVVMTDCVSFILITGFCNGFSLIETSL